MRSDLSTHNNSERPLMIRTENWWLYWKDNECKNGSSILTLLKYRISMVGCHFRRNEAKWISMSRFAKKWLGFEAWIKAIISTVKYTPAVKLQRTHTHTHARTHIHTRFVLHLDCEEETKREEEKRINRRKIESEKRRGATERSYNIGWYIINEHESPLLDDNEGSIDIRGTIVRRIISLFPARRELSERISERLVICYAIN